MTILKRIPRIISPQLLHTLARMGHGDTILLADANYPGASTVAKWAGNKLIGAHGHAIPPLLKAVCTLMPLDTYVTPVHLMQVSPEDTAKGLVPPVWEEYKRIVDEAEGRDVPVENIDRFEFYDVAAKASAVVMTGEGALYGNILLTKGVIGPE